MRPHRPHDAGRPLCTRDCRYSSLWLRRPSFDPNIFPSTSPKWRPTIRGQSKYTRARITRSSNPRRTSFTDISIRAMRPRPDAYHASMTEAGSLISRIVRHRGPVSRDRLCQRFAPPESVPKHELRASPHFQIAIPPGIGFHLTPMPSRGNQTPALR